MSRFKKITTHHSILYCFAFFISYIGIFDLLLHKRDVAYSVKTLQDWLKQNGLHFVGFDEYEGRHFLNTKYWVEDSGLRKALTVKRDEDKQHLMEILQGRVIMHSFYASKIDNSEAKFSDLINSKSLFLYSYTIPRGIGNQFIGKRNSRKEMKNSFFHGYLSEGFLPVNSSSEDICDQGGIKMRFSFKFNKVTPFLINKITQLTEGSNLHSIYSMYTQYSTRVKKNNLTVDDFNTLTLEFMNSIKDTDIFLLRKHNVLSDVNNHFVNCFQVFPANLNG